jgi:hypothetical protein
MELALMRIRKTSLMMRIVLLLMLLIVVLMAIWHLNNPQAVDNNGFFQLFIGK